MVLYPIDLHRPTIRKARKLNLQTILISIAIFLVIVAAFVIISLMIRRKKRIHQAELDKLFEPLYRWVENFPKGKYGNRASFWEIAQYADPPKSSIWPQGIGHYPDRQSDARQRVARVKEQLEAAKLIQDPLNRRDALSHLRQENNDAETFALSYEDADWIKEEITAITKDQVTALWTQALDGDSDALIELIVFTGSERYQSYRWYVNHSYSEPDGWQDLVAELLPHPTLEDLRIHDMEDGAVLLLAEEARREGNLTKAKIVMAFWVSDEMYQLLIPQSIMAELVSTVERSNDRKKSQNKTVQ